MANLPQVGLEAVFERAEEFLRRAEQVQQAYRDLAEEEARTAESSEGFGRAWEQMLGLMSLGALQSVAGTMGQVGDRMLGLAKDAVMTAARIEELDLVLGNLAEQNELSADAMRDQVQAIRDQGIQADVAYSLVSQFVRANLDLSKASELARLAQDAAVISMEDSSQALSGLLHGVLTLQPELLRYRGIIVDFQSEYKKWADANNRTVLSLTAVEKQQIALDAALAQGSSIAGTYESAMESASKQLRSMPRYIADLKAEMGEALLPVYSDVIFATKDLIKEISGLPGPIKATVAATGALAGGMLKGVSAMVGFGAQAAQLIVAMQALQGTVAATSLAFLGPLGLVAALTALAGVGIASYLKEQEQAHQEEALAILDSTTKYENYLLQVQAAELGSYALSESLYEIAKAAAEAGRGLTAAQLTEALRELESVFGGAATGIEWLDNFIVGLNKGQLSVGQLQVTLERLLPAASEAQLAILQDTETLERWAEVNDYSEEQTRIFIDTILGAVDAQKQLRLAADASAVSMGDHEELMLRLKSRYVDYYSEVRTSIEAQLEFQRYGVLAARAVEDAFEGFGDAVAGATPEVRKLRDELIKLAEEEGLGAALALTKQRMADAVRDAEEEVAEIRDKAQADRERALKDHLDKEEDLYDDYKKRINSILEDLADVDEQLLADRAEAEAQYQADRLAAVAAAAAEMAELMAQQAAELAELQEELARDLEEIDRKGREARADAARDLARDLEEIDRDLAERERAVWEGYYADLEKLAEDHGQRMSAITERYADERARIEDKYRTQPEETFDTQREALLRELEELREQQEAMQRRGLGYLYEQRERELLEALDALKAEELAALEEAQAAELAAEEEAYQERLTLAEQRRDEELQAERDAAEEARQERQRRYQETLDDLELSLQRQRDSRRRAYDERLAELQQGHAAERAEQERRAAEALAQLDDRIAQENARLDEQAAEDRARLQERLADEKASYAERQTALDEAYDEQLTTIQTKTDEQAQLAKDKADEITNNLIQAWESIDPAIGNALQSTYDNQIRPWVDRVLDEIRRLKQGIETELQSSPKSGWFEKVGKSMVRGLEAGFDIQPVLNAQLAALGGFQQQTVQAAVPPQMAAASATTSIDNTRNYNLSYTGQPRGEADLRSLMTMMEMRSGG